MANQPTKFSDNHLVRGMDVSHHQSIIDWQKVASSGIAIAFAKATEGIGLQDTHFAVPTTSFIRRAMQGLRQIASFALLNSLNPGICHQL